ncbi:serine hydrolase domain-containing protein [Halorubellus salinus]|uniref:serine hydrolase domain-containing protein n=1 Tax=Halorubellus salinus TaxID=755309 RepID=UPI001D08B4EC
MTTAPPTSTTQEPSTETETTTEPAMPTTGPPLAGVEAFDEHVPDFMRKWDVPAATVAVARGEDLVFTRGYGYADRETDAVVQPDSLFRIGSISKPITAVTVLELVQRGELSLDDRMVDLLPDLVPDGGPKDPRVGDVTVRNLLTHTAGWSEVEMGYDPVFESRRIAEAEGETTPASAETTLTYVLRQDLSFDPGTAFAYANVGYVFLGRIVEAVTGRSYQEHVQERVLDPLGMDRMQIGNSRRRGRLEDEVRYYDDQNRESVFPDGGTVPVQYGSFSMRTLDAAGGWVGSTVDLCRLFRGFDGMDGVPDVLDEGTRGTMTARPSLDHWEGANQYYGKGWFVVPRSTGEPTLWHNGSVPGSYGFCIRDGPADLTAAVLFNGRSTSRFPTFNREAQSAFITAFSGVSSWPDRDLYDQYD